MKITRSVFVLTLVAWWLLFVLLSITQVNGWQVLNVVGFGALLACFGLPAYVLLGVKKQHPIVVIASIAALGTLALMAVPLLFNWLLPLFGITRPLDKWPLLIELSATFAMLVALAFHKLRGVAYRVTPPKVPWLDGLFLAIPALFVGMSVMGATLLNNGGSGWITLAMLFGMTIYLAALLMCRRRLSDTTIAAALFMIAAALLFMTSLRGWLTTGHDVQREFRMFQMTHLAGFWDITAYRDPYNACLSITILPTVFANLLHLADPYIFKVLFQLLFAVVPVMVYFLMRRYVGKGLAMLATLYFISFPTFFGDMPMLDRQEIAFMFLTLMLYFVLDKNIGLWKRRRIFLLFGLGLVLSHYSTTYSFVVIVGVLVAARPVFRFLAGKLRNLKKRKGRRRLFADSGIAALADPQPHKDVSISFATVALLVGMVFIWNTVLTNTSQGLATIVQQLGVTIASGFKSDARSNDTSYSLVSAKSVDPRGQLEMYQKTIIDKTRRTAPPGTYYDNATVAAYPLTALPPPTLPLTPAGNWLAGSGVDVPLFNFAFKQISARLLQLFIAIGIVFIIFRRLYLNKPMDTDFILVVFGSLAFIIVQIVLPFLSVEYGLLRAFQQSLIVLGLFVAVGTFVIVMPFKIAALQRIVPAALALVFFVSSTSAVGQLLGGNNPQLHLNNAGIYYDIYYLHKGEIAAIEWIAPRLDSRTNHTNVQAEVQSDRYALTKLLTFSDLYVNDDIAPGLVRKNSYVFLSYANVNKHQATVTYNSDLVTYDYPVDFLANNKNLVYSNGQAEIYR